MARPQHRGGEAAWIARFRLGLRQQRRPHTYVTPVLRMDDRIEVRTRPRVGGRLLRDQLVVRDTTIVRHDLVPIPPSSINDARSCGVEDLFADLARALADQTAASCPSSMMNALSAQFLALGGLDWTERTVAEVLLHA